MVLSENPSLCYVGNISALVSNTEAQSCIFTSQRRNASECSKFSIIAEYRRLRW